MRGRNQDPFSAIGNSIKMIGIAALLFALKYALLVALGLLAVYGVYLFLKKIF
jgi:hypothetical protein